MKIVNKPKYLNFVWIILPNLCYIGKSSVK